VLLLGVSRVHSAQRVTVTNCDGRFLDMLAMLRIDPLVGFVDLDHVSDPVLGVSLLTANSPELGGRSGERRAAYRRAVVGGTIPFIRR
jgi:hypothetical protein